MKFPPIGLAMVTFCSFAALTQAELIAYEPFTTGDGAYTVGEIDNQNPTVAGFTSAWTINPGESPYSGGTVSSTGLTYPGLPTTGGMYAALNARWYRELSTPFTTATSGTYWMSYLYQSTEANGGIFQAFETYTTGANPGTDSTRTFAIVNGAEGWGGGGAGTGQFSIQADNTKLLGAADTGVNLFVIKMEFDSSGNDTFTVWRNPDLSSEPTTGGVAWTGNLSFSYVGIFNANSSGEARFDELRIGTTFADVIGGSGPEPTPYEIWAGSEGYNLSGGPSDDDDGDGLTNFEEFAFGLDPTSGASVNPITDISELQSDGIFSYTRNANSELSYTCWISTDLQDWGTEPATVLLEEAGQAGENGVQTVVVVLDLPKSDEIFLRVKAAETSAP